MRYRLAASACKACRVLLLSMHGLMGLQVEAGRVYECSQCAGTHLAHKALKAPESECVILKEQHKGEGQVRHPACTGTTHTPGQSPLVKESYAGHAAQGPTMMNQSHLCKYVCVCPREDTAAQPSIFHSPLAMHLTQTRIIVPSCLHIVTTRPAHTTT